MNLSGKAVIVTGAKGGLGTFVTNAFLDAGARVAGVSRSIKDADFPKPGFTAIPSDLSSGESASAMVAAAVAKFGRVDVLVHLMGGYAGGATVADTPDATLLNMLDMNFKAAFFAIRAVLPGMRAQGEGRILAVGSMAAVQPSPTAGAYAASKAALVSLVNTVAAENFDRGITANSILPGTIDTPGNRAAMPGADTSTWVPPAQLAALLRYLASSGPSRRHGTAIRVCWG